MLSQSLAQLKHASVQNLAWAIGGPSLIRSMEGMEALDDSFFSAALQERLSWLKQIDQDPSELEAFLGDPPTGRLGIYFERLVSFWLRHDPEYELIAENLQVREGGHTYGAFDFILRNSAGQVQHWELAIKYYLKRFEGDDWSVWVGPNKIDRLDKKLQRMRDHQLPLSSGDLGKQTLRDVGVTQLSQRRAFVKGMLFRKWNEEAKAPAMATANQPEGLWVELSDVVACGEALEASAWMRRDKPDWLVPAVYKDESALSSEQISTSYEGLQRPVMLSALDKGQSECMRVFLVPDGWAEEQR